MIDLRHRRQLCRVVHRYHGAIGFIYIIYNRRRRGDELQLVLALQALLHHVHVEEAQEAAAETKAQGLGCFRYVLQCRIIELQFFQRYFQIVIVLTFDGIEAAENHGQRLAISGERFGRAILCGGDGIPHFAVRYGLDASRHITYRAAGQHIAGLGERREITHFRDRVHLAGRHHADIHARTDFPILHTHIGNGAFVGVENGIKNEAAQRLLRVILRRRHLLYDTLQHRFHILPGLRTHRDGLRHIETDDILYFRLHALYIGTGKVYLIDDRNDFQVVVQSQVHIGQCLGLHALGGIDDQNRPFTSRQAAGYFVIEIHMPWGIDEVQLVGLPIFIGIIEPHRLLFDGDAALPLQLHGIQDLRFHVTLLHRAGDLDQAVRQRRLAVVDVCNNRKIPDVFCIHTISLFQTRGIVFIFSIIRDGMEK